MYTVAINGQTAQVKLTGKSELRANIVAIMSNGLNCHAVAKYQEQDNENNDEEPEETMQLHSQSCSRAHYLQQTVRIKLGNV
jgi:hypothetical protein